MKINDYTVDEHTLQTTAEFLAPYFKMSVEAKKNQMLALAGEYAQAARSQNQGRFIIETAGFMALFWNGGGERGLKFTVGSHLLSFIKPAVAKRRGM